MSSSPLPQQPGSSPHVSYERITFPEAITAIIDGKSVTKKEWGNPAYYGKLRNGLLMLHRDDKWFKWIVNDGDLLGDDWIILEP